MFRTLFSRFTPRGIPTADISEGRDSPELLSILIPLPLNARDVRVRLTYVYDF